MSATGQRRTFAAHVLTVDSGQIAMFAKANTDIHLNKYLSNLESGLKPAGPTITSPQVGLFGI